MANPHKVLLITTGGTIAGQVAMDKKDAEMKQTAGEFRNLIGETISYLDRKHNLKIDVDPYELCNEDSSNILPQHWIDLVATIKKKYDEYNSFVITHGTNTLGYTCAALSFAIVNPDKPIILTGSQVSAGLPGSDALINLQNALRVAVWPRENKTPIKGVMAVFGSYIITGTRVKKDTEFDYDAFKSFSSGAIGRIGRIINIDDDNLKKHWAYINEKNPTYPPARMAKDLLCENDFDMRIASLTEFPGMSSEIFQNLAEANDIRGFILRAFGAGDPCERHFSAFEYLKRKKIPLVVTTQAPNGNSNFQVNEPGRRLLEGRLAIPAYDMSIESQTTKLAWLLAQMNKGEITYEKICSQYMLTDMKGEISTKKEYGA